MFVSFFLLSLRVSLRLGSSQRRRDDRRDNTTTGNAGREGACELTLLEQIQKQQKYLIAMAFNLRATASNLESRRNSAAGKSTNRRKPKD